MFLLLGTAGISGATLFDKGGGLIYDNFLDITWLQDANYADAMTWNDALTWAENLEYGSYSDWRLPNKEQTEMYHLYHSDYVNSALPYPFSEVQSDWYWTATDAGATLPDTPSAWAFNFSGDTSGGVYGIQKALMSPYYAWAVRDGDVTVIPEPTTMFLLGAGLIGLAGYRRKFRKR